MSLAVFANVNPDMSDNGLKVCVVNIIQAMHIIDFVDPEHSKVAPEGLNTRCGHRSADDCGVMLHDPCLNKPFRAYLGKVPGLDTRREVTIDHCKRCLCPGIDLSQIGNGFAPGTAVIRLGIIDDRLTTDEVGLEQEGICLMLYPGRMKVIPHLLVFFEFIRLTKLLERIRELFLGECRAMIFCLVFHEGNALAHDRMREDHCRLSHILCLSKRI